MIEELARALHHLYDLAYLETSPLAARVGLGGHNLRGRALRQAIMEAIEALRPPLSVPARDAAWRAYQILEGRYIAGHSRSEVQEELALAKSQYYREHVKALEALASILVDRWPALVPTAGAEPPGEARDDQGGPYALALRELDELVRQEPEQALDLGAALGDVVGLLNGSLPAEQQIALDLGEGLLRVRSRPGILRQGLLMLLSAANRGAQRARLSVSVAVSADQAQVVVAGWDAKAGGEQGASLGLADGFLRAAGGQVTQGQALAGPVVVGLPLERAARQVLLVDNASELADLYTRYLEGEPWALRYAPSVGAAVAHCADDPPDLVLLDVLMPEQDGWHLLARLKSCADTAAIPVVVCSVLDQPELAVSLGAAGTLRKPITRDVLLGALARWGGAA